MAGIDTSQQDSPFSFADLFCGAGGLSHGFRTGGFTCICAIDNDESAVNTYGLNFQDHIIRADITEETSLDWADVIVGGPPCQGFSSAGMRRSDDNRNTLVRVFAELIAKQKPRAFVFENVEGFITTDNGERVFDLLEPLIQAGYRIHLRKINAANYGVPQHRKRVIAIGGLGWDPTFPEPAHMAYGAPGASSTFRHLPRCPSLYDALEGLPPLSSDPPGFPQGHFARKLSKLDLERIHLLSPGGTMKDLPKELWHESYRRRAYRRVRDGTPTERRGGSPYGLRRLRIDQPSKAITSGAISELVHPLENRFVTLRECARIQTFPDNFVFAGTTAECSRQIGNAVPPRLAQAIAEALMDDLRANKDSPPSPEGMLLTFLPTTSTGMSPALQKVCRRIEEAFMSKRHTQMEQARLWR